MSETEYTTSAKRKALAVAHQMMLRYRARYAGKRFCGDAHFGMDEAINVISAMYENAVKEEMEAYDD